MTPQQPEPELPSDSLPSWLFTFRVWQTRVDGGSTEWRGRLQSVNTGHVRYFRDWQRLVLHLNELLQELDATNSDTSPKLENDLNKGGQHEPNPKIPVS
jgi:hypothetical protein